MFVVYHAYISKISILSSFGKINGKVLWKKNYIREISEMFERFLKGRLLITFYGENVILR